MMSIGWTRLPGKPTNTQYHRGAEPSGSNCSMKNEMKSKNEVKGIEALLIYTVHSFFHKEVSLSFYQYIYMLCAAVTSP